MALFRRTKLNGPAHPADSTLSVLVVFLLIGLVFAAWYFRGTFGRTVDHTNTGASTFSKPVTSPTLPNASPIHPPPSPNPSP